MSGWPFSKGCASGKRDRRWRATSTKMWLEWFIIILLWSLEMAPNWRGHEKPNAGDGLRVDYLMPLILSERL